MVCGVSSSRDLERRDAGESLGSGGIALCFGLLLNLFWSFGGLKRSDLTAEGARGPLREDEKSSLNGVLIYFPELNRKDGIERVVNHDRENHE